MSQQAIPPASQPKTTNARFSVIVSFAVPVSNGAGMVLTIGADNEFAIAIYVQSSPAYIGQ